MPTYIQIKRRNPEKWLFLPYFALRSDQKYRFLDGRPYLLSLAWLYRVISVLKERRVSTAARKLLSPFATKQREERSIWLKKWGFSPKSD